MFDIVNEYFENELFYDGNLILKYRIDYPQIAHNWCNTYKFNYYNQKIALALKNYIESSLFQDAKNTYEFNKANNYPIMVYEAIYTYTITYNQDNIISLYSDQYIYSGGAHGLTTRKSQNWNMQCGREILLNDVYENNPYFMLNILKSINGQIENEIQNGTNQYFDNYCKLVLETFSPKQFYIVSNSEIIIFYQQYDIAPYSSGIPTFSISY